MDQDRFVHGSCLSELFDKESMYALFPISQLDVHQNAMHWLATGRIGSMKAPTTTWSQQFHSRSPLSPQARQLTSTMLTIPVVYPTLNRSATKGLVQQARRPRQ
jgi:hypothetical protein